MGGQRAPKWVSMDLGCSPSLMSQKKSPLVLACFMTLPLQLNLFWKIVQ